MPSDQEYLQNAGITDTEATGSEAVSSEPQTETAAPTAGAEQTPTTPAEMFELMGNRFPVTTNFKIPHGGKVLEVPYTKLANTYRQAAHLEDKWGELKKTQAEWEPKLKEFDRYKGFYDKYGQLQEWSEKNPNDWQKLFDLYQNKDKHLLNSDVMGQQGQQTQGQMPGMPNVEPLVNKITQLEQALGKYDQMFTKLQEREAQEAEAKDVQSVKSEITDFGKEFPEIDVNEKDPDGVPLWAKIVQFGTANNFVDFTPAAHMYLKQRIADTYQSRARTEAMKTAKDHKMNGIVKRSATPFGQGTSQTKTNYKNLSYNDLANIAKQQLGT